MATAPGSIGKKKERKKKKKTLLFNNKRSSPSGLSRFFYYYYTFSLSLFFCSIFYDYHHFLFVFSGESSRLAGYLIIFSRKNGFRRIFVNGCRFFTPTIKDETGEFE
jgi:hypothetical protein